MWTVQAFSALHLKGLSFNAAARMTGDPTETHTGTTIQAQTQCVQTTKKAGIGGIYY